MTRNPAIHERLSETTPRIAFIDAGYRFSESMLSVEGQIEPGFSERVIVQTLSASLPQLFSHVNADKYDISEVCLLYTVEAEKGEP